jgi:hypothetical protein
MPRAKKSQLTNEEREHVDMVTASLINMGMPKLEAERRARLTVSDWPSNRHENANPKNARVGAEVARAGGARTVPTKPTARRSPATGRLKAGTGKRIAISKRAAAGR